MSDAVRDDILPNLGVRLEDHEGTLPSIKLVDRETLMKERAEKLKLEEAKNQEKQAKVAQKAKEQVSGDPGTCGDIDLGRHWLR